MLKCPGGSVPGEASLIITVAVIPGSPGTAGCWNLIAAMIQSRCSSSHCAPQYRRPARVVVARDPEFPVGVVVRNELDTLPGPREYRAGLRVLTQVHGPLIPAAGGAAGTIVGDRMNYGPVAGVLGTRRPAVLVEGLVLDGFVHITRAQ
jgi:hypothetical protein